MSLSGGLTLILHYYILKYKNVLFISLFVFVAFVWYLAINQNNLLIVAFLDVGQGDSIFIETPNGVQVLIDAGPNSSVLRGLQKQMSFFDRTIDMVVATHPDKDHIGGVPDVFKRFNVNTYVSTTVTSSSGTYTYLEELVSQENSNRVFVDKPLSFILDDGVRFDILFPNRNVSELESNTSSLIVKLTYNEHEFLFTGDSPKSIEKYLVSIYGESLQADVLKAGHHGSKTSSDERFISTVSPNYVIISAGENNRYGHPHEEVTSLFNRMKIPILYTKNGSVVFKSDGQTLKLK